MPVGQARKDAPRTRIATAPSNFGVYDTEDPIIGPVEYARLASDCGYEGTDLGPLGYLEPGLLNGIRLAGGWHDLRFGQHTGFEEDLAALDVTARFLKSLDRYPPGSPFAPKPTLACPPSLPLAPSGWELLVRQMVRAVARCRAIGLEPVFHHHLETSVETPEEIDRLLELTDVALCLDTGHLLAAGGDPLAVLQRWAPRVRQVHVKDARADGTFCRLGTGTLDLAGFVGALRELGYRGWIVVEQDAPATGQDLSQIVRDLRFNRNELARLGL